MSSYFFILVCCLCCGFPNINVAAAQPGVGFQPPDTPAKVVPKTNNEEPAINIKVPAAKPHEEIPVVKLDKELKKDQSSTKSASTTTEKPPGELNVKLNPDEGESGTLMRAIWVLAGISLLFIIYVGFKTCRGTNRRYARVHKYGVVTRRSDVEMEPLPVDEDDEDETVFDLGSMNSR